MSNASNQRLAGWERAIEAAFSRTAPSLRHLYCVEEVSSTMDLARDAISGTREGHLLCLAQRQTQGRGRQGRNWDSSFRGFYGTYGFLHTGPVSTLAGYSLAVGCAIRRFLEEQRVSALLKWPNDIFTAMGDKLGGVLIEIVSQGDRQWVLTGIGINLAGHPALDIPTSSIQEQGGQILTPPEVAIRLTPHLIDAWTLFSRAGFAAFREEFLEGAFGVGRRVSIEQGEQSIQGVIQGVDESGALLLQGDQGPIAVVSGHVRLQ